MWLVAMNMTLNILVKVVLPPEKKEEVIPKAHLSQKVEKNVKMLDLGNNNSTHTYTRAAVNTTVKLGVVKTTELPALDVEEEHVNMTMPSTAVSVPDSVKELTEADLKTANVTGEI
jgi:hypothetical protein